MFVVINLSLTGPYAAFEMGGFNFLESGPFCRGSGDAHVPVGSRDEIQAQKVHSSFQKVQANPKVSLLLPGKGPA